MAMSLLMFFLESAPFNLFAHHAEFFSLRLKPPSGYQVMFLCDTKVLFLKPIDGHKWFFCFMTFFSSSQSKPPNGHQMVFFL
jgi:hypothetical protein